MSDKDFPFGDLFAAHSDIDAFPLENKKRTDESGESEETGGINAPELEQENPNTAEESRGGGEKNEIKSEVNSLSRDATDSPVTVAPAPTVMDSQESADEPQAPDADAAATKSEESLQFEPALARLEAIVNEMESGKLSLDRCLERFEEGSKLAGFCTAKLEETARKVEILLRSPDGDGESWQPFQDSAPDRLSE